MNIKYKAIIYLFFLLGPLCTLHSQNKESCFTHYDQFLSQDSSKIFLRIENFNFVKNNEYKSRITKGATWIGYILSPKVVYYPNSRLRLEAGVRLQKFSGLNQYSQEEPLFTIHYQPTPKATMIMGSIDNNHNHNLTQPLFEAQRFFTDPSQEGIQLKYKGKKLQFDTWVNWEQFIFEKDPFQERLTFGITGQYTLSDNPSPYTLQIPIQLLTNHRGGEIDNSPDPVQTIINASTGISYQRQLTGSIIKSWGIETLLFLYKDNSPTLEMPYKTGHAIYPAVNLNTIYGRINLGYWNGYHFISPKGSLLFQSATPSAPLLLQTRKHLITAQYSIKKKIYKGVHLGSKIDIYIDPNNKTDISTALYLVFNRNFFLRKIKSTL